MNRKNKERNREPLYHSAVARPLTLPEVLQIMHVSGVVDEGDEILITGGIHVGAPVQFLGCLLLPQVSHQSLVDPVWVTHTVNQRFKHCTGTRTGDA